MDRLNRLLRPRAPSYEPLPDHSPQEPTQDGTPDADDGVSGKETETLTFEYVVFAVLGVAMWVRLSDNSEALKRGSQGGFTGCGHGICSWRVQPTSKGVLRRYV